MNLHCPRCEQWVHISQMVTVEGDGYEYMVCKPCLTKKDKRA